MCGIVGSINYSNHNVIKKMLYSIKHRGPDEQGYYLDNKIMLGTNRLSILDLKFGNQPMISENKNIILNFNGEISNYKELKEKLIYKGYKFQTKNSDTEVVLAAYLTYGLNFINYLDGMFAISLHDKKKQRHILIRDRAGIKPLFYFQKKKILIFSSEIKSLLCHPLVNKKINKKTILSFFALKNIPCPETIYSNIKQLEPGTILIFENAKLSKKKYFYLNKFKTNNKVSYSLLKKKLINILDESVKNYLLSDVEVGSFLSGGIDSSLISILASKYNKKKLKTFSLIYDNKNLRKDDYYSKTFSKFIKSEHHEFVIPKKINPDQVENALNCFDQPFGGTISSYFLSKHVSKYVKVALTGDGSDEIFGSYKYPRNVINNDHLKKTLSYIKKNSLNFYQRNFKYFFTNKLISEGSYFYNDYIKNKFKKLKSLDKLNSALIGDFSSLLPDQVLMFNDIHSMHSSLEVRPPFLSNKMIDFAFTVPDNLKIKKQQTKIILKDACKGILPQEIVNREKEGFVMPIENIFLSEQKKYLFHIFKKENLNKHGFFNIRQINHMINNFENLNFWDQNRLWVIFTFQIWWNKNF